MAEDQIDPNTDSDTLFSAKSAATLSALFVLRKLVFNFYRYKKTAQQKTFVNRDFEVIKADFLESVRLLKQSVYESDNQSKLENYIFQIQVYDTLYKLHHTLLDQIPDDLVEIIPEIDTLLREFHPDQNPEISTYFEELTKICDFLNTL